MPAQLLDKLRPIMEEIAAEQGVSVEDVLVRYMDLQSEAALLSNNTVLKGIDGIGPDGNPFYLTKKPQVLFVPEVFAFSCFVLSMAYNRFLISLLLHGIHRQLR